MGGMATPGTTGVSAGSGSGAGKLADVMLKYKNLHPATSHCLLKLDTTFPKQGWSKDAEDVLGDDGEQQIIDTADEIIPDVMEDNDVIKQMDVYLQPICELVDAIITKKEQVSLSLNSSPAINFGTLGRLLRSQFHGVVVPSSAGSLFATFGITFTVGKPIAELASEAPGAGVSQDLGDSQSSAVPEVVQRRYEEDVREAEREAQRSSPTGDAIMRSPPAMEGGQGTATEPNGLDDQITIIQQAVLFYLRDWMDIFPAPENRLWPIDFEREEVTKVKQYIRTWARDTQNGVNLDLHKQPDDKVNQIADVMVADEDFPVADAKQHNTIKSVFRDVCSVIYGQRLKTSQKQAEKAEKGAGDAAAGQGQEDETDGRGSKKTGQTGKAGKRARSSTPPDEGVVDRDRSPTKKTRADEGRYGDPGAECSACYFSGQFCELRVRNDPGRLCSTCFAAGSGCRILCDDCADTANQVGRGSQAESFLTINCQDCEYR